MRAGNLDRVINIDTNSPQQDETGQDVAHWLPFATMRAEMIQQSADEFLAANEVQGQAGVLFRTRYVEGVTVQCRVECEGRYFDLVEVKEIGRRKGLELRGFARAE